MQRITISLPEDLHERFEKLADESGPYDSKSEAVRGLIRDLEQDIQEYETELCDAYEQLQQHEGKLREYEQEIEHLTDEYEDRIDELERENDRLRDEYQERIAERREEHEREIERLKREHEERITELEEEHEEEIADLQEENERLRASRDDLQRQLAATNRRVDQHQELVDYVEEQRSLERYRARREQMIDQAGMLTRWKWRLTGVPVDEQDENEENENKE